jgi:hypothetical protein
MHHSAFEGYELTSKLLGSFNYCKHATVSANFMEFGKFNSNSFAAMK